MLGHPRHLARYSLAFALAVAACGGETAPPRDDGDVVDTSDDTLEPDTVDTIEPDTVAPDTVDAYDAYDTAPSDTVPDPLNSEDPTPPFLPEDPPAPVAVSCAGVVNANAEAGNLTGWTVVEGSFQAQDETSIFNGDYPPSFEGTYYFRAGDSERSRLQQDVPVAELLAVEGAPRIAVFDAFVSDYDARDDAWIGMAALDAEGAVLAAREQGPFTDPQWRLAEIALTLPEGTATVRLELKGIRHKGTSNDAYFDAMTLCFFDEPPRADMAQLYALPYLMNVTPTEVTVMFETRSPLVARVDYGAAPDALDMSVTEPAPVTTHQVRLTGLAPGARSWYRVVVGDVALPPYDFKTALLPEDDGRIEFVELGDNQDGPEIFAQLTREIAALDPDFVLHAGDCVQNGQREDYRNTFFGPFFGLGNHAPLVMAEGNHETYSSGIFVNNASRALWEEYVDQPGDEHCFGFRWGSLFVLVLDTEQHHGNGTAQFACAEEHLKSEASKTATFRTAIFHRPALVEWWDSVASFPSPVTFFAGGMDAPDVREALAPLFEQHGVQLVFNGHNHLYQYVPAWPWTVAWVSSGGGGGGLESGAESSRVNDWSPYVETTIFQRHHFLRVVIENRVMGVEAVALGGEVLHSFYILPRPSAPPTETP